MKWANAGNAAHSFVEIIMSLLRLGYQSQKLGEEQFPFYRAWLWGLSQQNTSMFPGFENAEAELVSNGRNKILQISERPYSPALYIDAIISGWIMDEVFKKT